MSLNQQSSYGNSSQSTNLNTFQTYNNVQPPVKRNDAPQQKFDKNVLNKIPSVPTKSNNSGKRDSGRKDCVIF